MTTKVGTWDVAMGEMENEVAWAVVARHLPSTADTWFEGSLSGERVMVKVERKMGTERVFLRLQWTEKI